MRTFIITLFLLHFLSDSFAQKKIDSTEFSNKQDAWRGSAMDIGFNQYANNPDLMDLNTWRSKFINIYYYFGTTIGYSKFTLAFGYGLGLENYSFDDESVRLSSINDSVMINNSGSTIQPAYSPILNKKSKLSANYFDIPLELRFVTGKRPAKTFRIAVGGKIGFLFDAHTKIKYETINDSEEHKEKVKSNFGLEKFRYGLIGRIGYGFLNFYGYYSLSTLFKDGKGPSMNPYMIGLSFSPSYGLDKERRRKLKVPRHFET